MQVLTYHTQVCIIFINRAFPWIYGMYPRAMTIAYRICPLMDTIDKCSKSVSHTWHLVYYLFVLSVKALSLFFIVPQFKFYLYICIYLRGFYSSEISIKHFKCSCVSFSFSYSLLYPAPSFHLPQNLSFLIISFKSPYH